jgi:hypothetical protein
MPKQVERGTDAECRYRSMKCNRESFLGHELRDVSDRGGVV